MMYAKVRNRVRLMISIQKSITPSNGIKVILTDQPLPTQVISYVVKTQKLTAGIMVTASHNPAQFNGIKIKGAFGGSAENRVTNKIEQLIFKQAPFKMPIGQAEKKKLLKVVD